MSIMSIYLHNRLSPSIYGMSGYIQNLVIVHGWVSSHGTGLESKHEVVGYFHYVHVTIARWTRLARPDWL